MASGEIKTKPTGASVSQFIDSIDDEQKRKDARELVKIMGDATSQPAKMWGDAIIGFGDYEYAYDSGRRADWFCVGFSPRKANFSIYLMGGYRQFEDILARLGKYKTAKSCFYINKLSDINKSELQELIERSCAALKDK